MLFLSSTSMQLVSCDDITMGIGYKSQALRIYPTRKCKAHPNRRNGPKDQIEMTEIIGLALVR